MKAPNSLGKIDQLLSNQPRTTRTFTTSSELASNILDTYENHSLKHQSLEDYIEANKHFVLGIPTKLPAAKINRINNKTFEEYEQGLQMIEPSLRGDENEEAIKQLINEAREAYNPHNPLDIPTGYQTTGSRLQQIVGSLPGQTIELDAEHLEAKFYASRPQVIMHTGNEYLAAPTKRTLDLENQVVTLHYSSHGKHEEVEAYKKLQQANNTKNLLRQQAAGRALQVSSLLAAGTLPFFMDWQLSTALAGAGVLGGELLAQRSKDQQTLKHLYSNVHEDLHNKLSDPLLLAPITQSYASELLNRKENNN